MRAAREVSLAILGIGLIVASLPASAAAQSKPAPPTSASAAGGDLPVTVTYTGKGVRAVHRPDRARGLHRRRVRREGRLHSGRGAAALGHAGLDPREKKTGSGAAPVKPGKGAKVAISFNDAVRMQR